MHPVQLTAYTAAITSELHMTVPARCDACLLQRSSEGPAAFIAAEVSATVAVRERGMFACGTAPGYDKFIADHVQQRRQQAD